MAEFISPNKLERDVNQTAAPSDSYNFALNAVVESFSEENSFPFLSNAPSNFLSSLLNDGEVFIGSVTITEFNTVILFSKQGQRGFIKYFKYTNQEQYSNFLKLTSLKNFKQSPFTKLELISESNCLDLSQDRHLNIIYKITETTLNLYFVDGINPDRYLYLDYNSNFDLTLNESFRKKEVISDCEVNYLNELDCNSILWDTKVNYPSLTTSVVEGGNKQRGKYSYLVAYSTEKGIPLSEYKSLSEGISVHFPTEDTNYAVEINIKDLTLDSRFRFFTVVGVKSRQGQTSFFKVGTYPINTSTVIDSEKNEDATSFEEIFYKLVYYKNSKFISSQNNILFRASLAEYDKFNLQKVVNKIHLNWIRVKLKEGDYKNPSISSQYRGYLSDESYVFGIKFILSNLQETQVFPIPNREKDTYGCLDTSPVQNLDSANTLVERYQVYNTAKVNNTFTVDYNPDDPQIYQEGEFAYQESTDKYPNIPEVWGDLCNQNIRLHKFPDLLVSDFHSNESSFDSKNYIYPLGVKISDSIDIQVLLNEAVSTGLISLESRNRIVGYKIVRANRSYNKSIVAKGLLYDVWNYEETDEEGCLTGNKYYYPNYPFNDLSDDVLLSKDPNHYKYTNYELNTINPNPLTYTNEGKYTFHSPDTHFVEPSIGRTLKVEKENRGVSKGFFTDSKSQAKHNLLTKQHYNVAITLAQWLTITIDSPSQEAVEGVASTLGSSILGTVGGAFGLGSLGSTLGGLVGGLIGSNLANDSFSTLLFKNSIVLAEAEKFIQLFTLLSQPRNYHKQYQAVGNYNTSVNVPNNGQKIREIVTSAYLDSNKVTIPSSNILFNNQNREKSVYLELGEKLPNLAHDNSRVKINNQGGTTTPIYSEDCYEWLITATGSIGNRFTLKGLNCDSPGGFFIGEYNNDDINITVCAKEILILEADNLFGKVKLDKGDLTITKGNTCGSPQLIGYEKEDCKCTTVDRYSSISSYYVSIKNEIKNQYGNIYDLKWVETHSNMKSLNKCLADIIKPVNLIPVSLSQVSTEPTKIEVISDLDCVSETNLCDLEIDWDTANTFSSECLDSGKSQLTVGVRGNANNIIQFSLNNQDWEDANIGTNKYTFQADSNGNCVAVYYRIKGCTNSVWGCILSKQPTDCVPNIDTPETPSLGVIDNNYTLTTELHRLNLNQFSDFSLPNKFSAVFGFGSPLFTEMAETTPVIQLKKGWTHTSNSAAYSFDKIPNEATSAFYVVSGSKQNQNTLEYVADSLGYTELANRNFSAVSDNQAFETGKTFAQQRCCICDPAVDPDCGTTSGNYGGIYNKSIAHFHFDEEVWTKSGDMLRVKGKILQGIRAALGSSVNLLVNYGNGMGGFYSGNPAKYHNHQFTDAEVLDSVTWYPFGYNGYDEAAYSTGDSSTGSIIGIYHDFSGGYFRAPVSETSSLYQKDSNGSYILDSNGKRKFRTDDFTETLLGQPTNFLAQAQPNTYAYINNFCHATGNGCDPIHDVFWGINQQYRMYDKIVQALSLKSKYYRNTLDISTYHDDPQKGISVIRPVTENYTYGGNASYIREVGEYGLLFMIYTAYLSGLEAVETWENGTLGVSLFSPNSTQSFRVRAMGNPLYQNQNENNGGTDVNYYGRYEVLTKALKDITDAFSNITFDSTLKYVHFTGMIQGFRDKEIISSGIYQNGKLVVSFTNPYADPTDSIEITVSGGGVNSTYTLVGRKPVIVTFTLPSGLTSKDISIKYKNIDNQEIHVSGNLWDRDVVPSLTTSQPPVTTPSNPTIPTDQFSLIGNVGYTYGSDYLSERNQKQGGVAIFNYYGNPNTNNYPSPNPCCNSSFSSYTSDFVIVNFPTHSVNFKDSTASKVSYKIKDTQGNVILEVYDTKGGTITPNERANNHPDQGRRWIKKGIYTFEGTNMNDDKTVTFRAGTTNDANGDSIFTVDIPSGQSTTQTLDFTNNPVGSSWHSFKLNCNVY